MRADDRFDVCELEDFEVGRVLDTGGKGLGNAGSDQALLGKMESVEVSPAFALVWAHESEKEGDLSVGRECDSSVFQIMPSSGMIERLACPDKSE